MRYRNGCYRYKAPCRRGPRPEWTLRRVLGLLLLLIVVVGGVTGEVRHLHYEADCNSAHWQLTHSVYTYDKDCD